MSLSVDCQHVGERPARPLGNLPTDGFEMLGKLTKTRGPNSGSAPVLPPPPCSDHLVLTRPLLVLFSTCSLCWSFFQFALQSFEIVCNTTWASEDTCCDLPGVVSLLGTVIQTFKKIMSKYSSFHLFPRPHNTPRFILYVCMCPSERRGKLSRPSVHLHLLLQHPRRSRLPWANGVAP